MDIADQKFRTRAQFFDWSQANAHLFGPAAIQSIIEQIERDGFIEPLTNEKVTFRATDEDRKNLRERLVHNGINSRQRAVLHLLEEAFRPFSIWTANLYAPEAITPMAMRLRAIFPRFLGSEYTDEPERRASMFPIAFQDLTNLTLPMNWFDFVLTNEVLEHVPDLDAALREMCRVLKPGGSHIGTMPFIPNADVGIRRAEIRDGKLVHLTSPEYHGDPFGGKGSLVFEIPAWDIIDRAHAAGFSDAHMRFVASAKHGYLTENTGVFVLVCRK